MAASKQRFCVVSSESCDDYVIPFDKYSEFEEWEMSEDAALGDAPPDWAKLIDGGTLTFTNWKIER